MAQTQVRGDSALSAQPDPTSSWLVAALIVVTAASTFVMFVPFWTGMAGLAWSNDHAWELTYLSLGALALWLGCAWAYSAIVWPPPTGTSASGAPRQVTTPQLVLSTIFMAGVLFLQVSFPAIFLVEMVSGTSAEIYSGWIIAAFIVPAALALLSAAISARPRLLMTDAMMRFHGLDPDTEP